MINWILRNKGKILLLYAIKVVLFIPHIVNAETIKLQPIDDFDLNGTFVPFSSTTVTGTFNQISWKQDITKPPLYTGITVADGVSTTTYQALYSATGGIFGGSASTTTGYFTSCLSPSGTTTVTSTSTLTNGTVSINGNSYSTVFYGQIFGDSAGGHISAVLSYNPIDCAIPNYATSTLFSCVDPTTKIINFTPEDGTTTNNPVNFTLDACINPDDLGTIKGVHITLHNIDQNVLLLGSLSPNDIYLLKPQEIQIAGPYSFSTTTIIAEGNYRLEACIEKSYFFGFIINSFSDISDCTSHQFVVGSSTFIGNISQRIYGDTNDFYNQLTSTSSEALANTCNPLNGNFGIRECMAFLFIPDGYALSQTMEDARQGILTRVPWGYFTRVVTILKNPSTTTLPSWTASIQMGAGDDMTPEITTITIDPSDMLAGGASLLESVHDPITDKSPKDVFYPMVQLTVALAVLMTIISDLSSLHRHANTEESRKGKLS